MYNIDKQIGRTIGLKNKIIRILAVALLLALSVPNVVFASGYDVSFTVVSTSPIGATVRATINGSPSNVQMVVLNLDDISNGILPQNARQQEIKYSEVNQIISKDVEVKTGIMGDRVITIDDVITKASESVDITNEVLVPKYSKTTTDYLATVKKAKPNLKIKQILKDEFLQSSAGTAIKSDLTKVLTEMPDTVRSIVSYDVKIKKQETKTNLVKNKSPVSVTFDIPVSTTLEATVTSGAFQNEKGWGSSGVVALIIDGVYYYDMSHSSWWSTAYANRMTFTIDKTNVSADLTNFPVKLWLSSSSGISNADITAIFTNLTTNSLKIAVTTADNSQQCYVEVVSWNYDAGTPANSTAELYVNVPNVYTASDTVINFYYDATQANNTSYVGITTSTPAKAVWDASFAAVYHMNDGADNAHIYDSTSNANHGTKTAANNPLQVDGLKGKAESFNGTSSYIATFSMPYSSNGTIESLFNPDATISPPSASVFPSLVSGAKTTVAIQGGTGKPFFQLLFATAGYKALVANTALTGGVTTYTAGTWGYSAPTTTQNIYFNGAVDKTPLTTSEQMSTGTENKTLGAANFKGTISEVRISSVARSAAWIKAANYSLRDTLVSWGSETNISIPSITTNAASGINSTTATLNGDVISAGNGDLTTRGFKWGTTSGTYPNDWNEASSSTGAYTYNLTTIFSGTVYYVVYATNQAGIGYGNEQSFIWYPLPPTNFISTISGNNINLSWTLGLGAVDTIIIRGDSTYPISLTDGTQIYNGTGTSYIDLNMNSESASHYYSAWSFDNITGLYSLTYATTLGGGSGMALIGLIILAGILTWFAITKIPVLGIVVFGLAIGLAQYIHSNPLPGIAIGSSVDTIITICLWGWGIMVALYCSGKVFSNDGRSFASRAFSRSENQHVYNHNGNWRSNKPDTSTMAGRQAAYRQSIHGKLNQK